MQAFVRCILIYIWGSIVCNLYGQNVPAITNTIVVGGVTSGSARFWCRLDSTGSFSIQLSKTQAFSNSIHTASVPVSELSNFAGIAEVTGLQPETKYYYRAIVNGTFTDTVQRSFTTFPVAGSARNYAFAFGSCQQSGNFLPSGTPSGNVFREVKKKQPAFFLQIGDWCYPDTTDATPFNNDYFSNVFEYVQKSYEAKFSLFYPMGSLMRICPVDYVYDDHDFMNDNASAASASFAIPFKPSPLSNDFVVMEIPALPDARLNSIRGYKENMPTYPLVNESRGIYHTFTYGNCEFFMLDLRSQRTPNLAALKKNSATGKWEFNPGSERTILGRDSAPGNGESQLTWFLNALKNSTADWKFLVCSVPFNIAQKQAIDIGLALQDSILQIPPGILPAGTTGIFAPMDLCDKWVGFPNDIDTLMKTIKQNNLKNIIVLSGDSHTAAMDDGTNAGLPEIMAAGLDITNSKTAMIFAAFGMHIWNGGGQGLTTPDFNNAFGYVHVFGKDSVRLQLIDEYGTQFAQLTIPKDKPICTETEYTKNFRFTLAQNFPNPFNPSTTISFNLAEPGDVKVLLYDILGREVKQIYSGAMEMGEHSLMFQAEGLSSGVYMYSVTTGGMTLSKKMVLLR